MINVALADDHEIVRNGIKMLLEMDSEIQVIWEASDGEETLKKINTNKPDVLIADIRMPLKNGLEVASDLKERPDIKVIILTMHNESEYILKSLEYGADGYLLKDTSKSEFIKAIKMINGGQKYYSGDISNTIINSFTPQSTDKVSAGEPKEYPLTKREKEILKLIYNGVGNKEIADQLGKSIRTIETHRFNIMKKLEVNNITELLKKVESEDLIKLF
ncbi:MAG: response regulator transcription factor [Bacteroidota bacterium]